MDSLVSVYRRYPTGEAAIAHLETVRWPDGPICPYCASPKASRKNEAIGKTLTARRWQCQACRKSYSVTVNTIFHNSHVDLQRWFLLISLMLNAKKGLSAAQASRDLEIRMPTVWSMMHRIRAAMARDGDGDMLSGLVEVDETYVGGKPRKANRRDDDPPAPRGHASNKQPIVGIVERGGRAKAKAVASDAMSRADMLALMRGWVRPGSVVHSDEYPGYNTLGAEHMSRRINHSREYLRRDLFDRQFGPIHTNTIEGLWAILKRAIIGQFHHISRKYIGRYLSEITFRYNNRRGDMFGLLLNHAVKPQSV